MVEGQKVYCPEEEFRQPYRGTMTPQIRYLVVDHDLFVVQFPLLERLLGFHLPL